MSKLGILMHFLVLILWAYILGGLGFMGSLGLEHWWPLSSIFAGAAALLIHLIEIPVFWKRGKEKGLGTWAILWRTLVFGSIWVFFPLSPPKSKSSADL